MPKKYYDIKDFTGYVVDKQGNIYSMLPRGCRDRYDRSKWNRKPKLIRPRKTHKGYCRVYMRRDSTGKREDAYIHRIVAETFLPNPENKSQVNHKDCNPSDNALSNLEWVTHIENLNYGYEHGFKARDSKGRFCHKNKQK